MDEELKEEKNEENVSFLRVPNFVKHYDHLFQCRDCKAIGDLMTGIMSPPYQNKVIG